MKESLLLEFESSAFAVTPGEDDATNPGIYGKALATVRRVLEANPQVRNLREEAA